MLVYKPSKPIQVIHSFQHGFSSQTAPLTRDKVFKHEPMESSFSNHYVWSASWALPCLAALITGDFSPTKHGNYV